MWNILRRTSRFSSFDLKRIIQLNQFSLNGAQQGLPSIESIQASDSLRLVTALYGVGKEIFFNQSRATINKKKFTFGDDSW